MTPGKKLEEQNRRMNEYRREAQERWNLRSPYRQSVYIQHRLKGRTPEQAIELSRGKMSGEQR